MLTAVEVTIFTSNINMMAKYLSKSCNSVIKAVFKKKPQQYHTSGIDPYTGFYAIILKWDSIVTTTWLAFLPEWDSFLWYSFFLVMTLRQMLNILWRAANKVLWLIASNFCQATLFIVIMFVNAFSMRSLNLDRK